MEGLGVRGINRICVFRIFGRFGFFIEGGVFGRCVYFFKVLGRSGISKGIYR